MNVLEVIQNADLSIVRFVREYVACPILDALMPVVTLLGDKGILSLILAFALIIVNKGKSRKAGAVMLTAIVLGFLIGNMGIKPLVQRQRPCWIDDVALLIPNPRDFSFPSGHSLCAFETAVPICMFFGKKWGAAAMTAAVLVAFSRLYLYVHFPTDILCGAVLGTLFAFAAKALFDMLEKKKGIKL